MNGKPKCGIYSDYRILFILKKEENSDTWYLMNKLWEHYAKKNKPVTKR
jgi:hypothetical protein